MTKSEGMTKSEWTKPATAQLRAIGHSGFGFLSSFVIQRLMQIRFIVPMRAEKASDPSVNRTTPGPSQEGSEPSSAPVPLLGGVRGGFMVPMRARSERRLSMNRPTPGPSEEGSRRRSASCQFPSWEGLGVGSWSQCMRKNEWRLSKYWSNSTSACSYEYVLRRFSRKSGRIG